MSSDVFVVTGSEVGHLSGLKIERMQKIFLVKSLVESKYCCNFAIEFRKRLDMSLILNGNRESSVIPSYVSTEMLCG